LDQATRKFNSNRTRGLDEAQATHHSDAVCLPCITHMLMCLTYQLRVLNTFKTMIMDEDALVEEDLFILDKMKEMVSDPEVTPSGAAKQLLVLIERAVGRTFVMRTASTQSYYSKKARVAQRRPRHLTHNLFRLYPRRPRNSSYSSLTHLR
jgi:hypothetical protein